MGCRIMVGSEEGSNNTQAILFCSTSMVCFGPVMDSPETADAFCEFVDGDPRSSPIDELMDDWNQFCEELQCKNCSKWTYENGDCECQ